MQSVAGDLSSLLFSFLLFLFFSLKDILHVTVTVLPVFDCISFPLTKMLGAGGG